MEEKDSWSILVEYLKVAIALSAAIIAAAAAIYVDNAKIPSGSVEFPWFELPTRYFLFGGILCFFLVLLTSVLTLGFLSNHFLKSPSKTVSSIAASVLSAKAAAAAATAAAMAAVAKFENAKLVTATEVDSEVRKANAEAAATKARAASEEAQQFATEASGTVSRKSTYSSYAIFCANLSLVFLMLSVLSLGIFFYGRTRMPPTIEPQPAWPTEYMWPMRLF